MKRLVDETIWNLTIQLLSLDAKRQAIIEALAAAPRHTPDCSKCPQCGEKEKSDPKAE